MPRRHFNDDDDDEFEGDSTDSEQDCDSYN